MLPAAIQRVLENICAGRLRYLAPAGGPLAEPCVGPPPVKGYPPHSHSFAELVQAVEGTARLSLDRRTIKADHRTAWLVLPGTVHFETFDRAGDLVSFIVDGLQPGGDQSFHQQVRAPDGVWDASGTAGRRDDEPGPALGIDHRPGGWTTCR